jgi:hypothetical protein
VSGVANQAQSQCHKISGLALRHQSANEKTDFAAKKSKAHSALNPPIPILVNRRGSHLFTRTRKGIESIQAYIAEAIDNGSDWASAGLDRPGFAQRE